MNKLQRETLAERAIRGLREAIFSGEYLPGQRLLEEEVAARLDVSRSVVREAFYNLEAQGLVKSEHCKSKSVAVLSINEIADLVPLRLLMESLAATWAAHRSLQTDKEALRKQVSKFQQGLNNFSAYVEIDFRLHRMIWKLAGNQQLEILLERLGGPMIGLASRIYTPFLNELVAKETGRQEGSHYRIVEAICSGSAADAQHAMQKHILSFWKSWLNQFLGAETNAPESQKAIDETINLIDSLASIMNLDIPPTSGPAAS